MVVGWSWGAVTVNGVENAGMSKVSVESAETVAVSVTVKNCSVEWSTSGVALMVLL